jgi:hypothetical protein
LFRRLIATAFVVAIVASSSASAITYVCRYTGEVMDACCCPEAAPSSTPAVSRACCCDVHVAVRVASATSVRVSDESRGRSLVVASLPAPFPILMRAEFAVARMRPPSRDSRVYGTLRSLLI